MSGNTKIITYDEIDPDGCGHEDVCIAIGRDSQGNLCNMDWCPSLSTCSQILQDNALLAIGCPVISTCVEQHNAPYPKT